MWNSRIFQHLSQSCLFGLWVELWLFSIFLNISCSLLDTGEAGGAMLMVETFIWKVPHSNVMWDAGLTDRGFNELSVISPGKCYSARPDRDRFLLDSFQLLVLPVILRLILLRYRKKELRTFVSSCMNWSVHLKESKFYTLFTDSTLGVNNVHCTTPSWGPRKLCSYFTTLWIRLLRTTGIEEKRNPHKVISLNLCSRKLPFYFFIGLHLRDEFWSSG